MFQNSEGKMGKAAYYVHFVRRQASGGNGGFVVKYSHVREAGVPAIRALVDDHP